MPNRLSRHLEAALGHGQRLAQEQLASIHLKYQGNIRNVWAVMLTMCGVAPMLLMFVSCAIFSSSGGAKGGLSKGEVVAVVVVFIMGWVLLTAGVLLRILAKRCWRKARGCH